MPLVIRDLNTIVEAILDRIIAANVGFTDKSRGSVLRAIVESIAAEIDIQYYQLNRSYKSRSIDDAVDEDLDKLVSVLATRNQATCADGAVTFGRSTPAQFDIPIPSGTIVSTRKNASGSITEFKTIADTVILSGQTSVDVAIQAILPGKLYISRGQVSIMSKPIVGIEHVYNDLEINSGTDKETNDSLRSRAKMALSGLGKGTNEALRSALLDVDTVLGVLVLDRNRGNGTTDVSVVCSTMPPSQAIRDSIDAVVADTKASGIDVGVIYPEIKPVDVIITTTGDADVAGKAILNYFGTLTTGNTFIVFQCLGAISSAYGDPTIDVVMSAPTTNQSSTTSEIIRVGTITINGVVWQLG
jgi:uncharacterized phage protein gp47/JayE